MKEIKVGDMVKVVSGPAFVQGGRPITGKVVTLIPATGGVEGAAFVEVPSGGLWGFRLADLKPIGASRRRARA